MKLKLVIALIFFVLFSLINQPVVPVPVMMTTYFLAYLPSMLATGMTFWYYDSTMETKYTVLTTAAKSVIAWHATFSTIYYGQLTVISFWSTEYQEYWNNNSNHTCVSILPLSIGPTFLLSILEFQILRALFVFYPYEVLAFNHDRLAYPLVASVPTISVVLLLIIFLNNGGLCNVNFLEQLTLKLGMSVNNENFIFNNLNLLVLFHILILLVEAIIRLRNNWKVIIETVRNIACWWRRSNTVHPFIDQPSMENLLLNTYLNQYKVGPTMLLIICIIFLKVLSLWKYNVVDFSQAFLDCSFLGLPVYWVVSSDEISEFVKLKYNQLKYRFGYF